MIIASKLVEGSPVTLVDNEEPDAYQKEVTSPVAMTVFVRTSVGVNERLELV